ncbi:MAG: histone deacetylase family protein, partial [Rhodospirillaceae bacterium]|nr:histone deacetylase family protein [Rhodospirillaceae bacterium]
GGSGEDFRDAFGFIRSGLKDFAPDLLIISAGFDAHADDPLAGLNLVEDDFKWATEQLIAIADISAKGRVVSILEGGYDLDALAASVGAHIKCLMNAG